MNILLTKNHVRALTLNIDNLRRTAAEFVNHQIAKGVTKTDGNTASDEDISFDHFNQKIIFSYEENTACNCHPEYQTFTVEFSFDDFIKWVNETKTETEQFTEADIDL